MYVCILHCYVCSPVRTKGSNCLIWYFILICDTSWMCRPVLKHKPKSKFHLCARSLGYHFACTSPITWNNVSYNPYCSSKHFSYCFTDMPSHILFSSFLPFFSFVLLFCIHWHFNHHYISHRSLCKVKDTTYISEQISKIQFLGSPLPSIYRAVWLILKSGCDEQFFSFLEFS